MLHLYIYIELERCGNNSFLLRNRYELGIRVGHLQSGIAGH